MENNINPRAGHNYMDVCTLICIVQGVRRKDPPMLICALLANWNIKSDSGISVTTWLYTAELSLWNIACSNEHIMRFRWRYKALYHIRSHAASNPRRDCAAGTQLKHAEPVLEWQMNEAFEVQFSSTSYLILYSSSWKASMQMLSITLWGAW